MNNEWHFYRWNFDRYATVRPQIRASVRASTFEQLAQTPEARAIAETFARGQIPQLEAKAAWLTAECRIGDPIVFNLELPRFLNRIERLREGEEIASLLSELIFARAYLETWLEQTSVCGILPPTETARFASFARTYQQAHGTAVTSSRGGFLKRVFERNATPDELFAQLGDLAAEAVKAGEGLIVYAL